MGIKTPKYFKTISMFGKDNQEHHGILVERIHSSVLVKPGRLSILKGRTTAKTLCAFSNRLSSNSGSRSNISSDMVFRHALKKDFSKYRSNIIVQNGNSEAAVKAAQAIL
jgi:hypothetical protein